MFILRLASAAAMGAAVVFISKPPLFVAISVLALILLVWIWLINRPKAGIGGGRLQGLAWAAAFSMSIFVSNFVSVFFPQYWPWPQSLLGLLVGLYHYKIVGNYLTSLRPPVEGARAG